MRPAVSTTNLYSYLVTRHTGRAVRTSIEERLSELDGQVLTVLDFSHVPLIDFSCADEIVAKLVLHRSAGEAADRERFFLFRGLADHHRDPIQCALERHALAVAAQTARGTALLLGAVERLPALVWREVWKVGATPAIGLAAGLGIPVDALLPVLAELEDRRLLLRDGDTYLSFRWALEGGDPGYTAE